MNNGVLAWIAATRFYKPFKTLFRPPPKGETILDTIYAILTVFSSGRVYKRLVSTMNYANYVVDIMTWKAAGALEATLFCYVLWLAAKLRAMEAAKVRRRPLHLLRTTN